MAVQIKPSVTNPTIADIYEKIDTQKLNLKPDFQRKFVWTHEHQEQFLDTILNGFPFPEIYVCQGEVDTKKLRTTQVVIDGQQRLTTIKNYIEDTFEKPLKLVRRYADLEEGERELFLSYQIVLRDIGKVDDDLVREIFRRINLTKFKLEDIEIHNAVYDGQYIQTAKSIVKDLKLEDYGVFHESEFTRMADLHFVLQVMSTIQRGGYYHRDNEIEKCVAEFNDEYSGATSMKALLLQTFGIIEQLGLPLDSIWFRKSNFFTLAVELSIADVIPPLGDLKARLERMEVSVLSQKNNPDTELGTYFSYMYQGTNNRKSRVVRAETFQKYILKGDGF
jgi:hypothetical protein